MNGWWVIVRTSKWLIHTRTHGHTDAGDDNTRRPKLASGKKPYHSFLAAPHMISNVNSLAIVTSSICEPRAIVTSPWPIVLTLYLWTLSSSRWRCQPGRFSMVAHRHDRRGIYRCVLLRFHGRIEIDIRSALSWFVLPLPAQHSWGQPARPQDGRPHSCCAGSGSTNHDSADRIVVNSYICSHSTLPVLKLVQRSAIIMPSNFSKILTKVTPPIAHP